MKRLQSLDVFHSQHVVGCFEHPRSVCLSGFTQRLRNSDRIAGSAFSFLRNRYLYVAAMHAVRRMLQQRGIVGFTSERQSIASERLQQRNAPAREAFGAAERPRHRQFQHKIHTAAHSRFGAQIFIGKRRFPALNEVAAHDSDHIGIACMA